MRDSRPRYGRNKCAVLNLDNINERGTHWVAYNKYGGSISYVDSFGTLEPKIELI